MSERVSAGVLTRRVPYYRRRLDLQSFAGSAASAGNSEAPEVDLPTTFTIAISASEDLVPGAQPHPPSSFSFEENGVQNSVLNILIASDVHPIRIEAEAIAASLYPIPTVVEPSALPILRALPQNSLQPILQEIRTWAAGQEEVQRARFVGVSEPEDPEWTELVLELTVDADTERALELWEAIGAKVGRLKAGLSPEHRDLVNSMFGLHFRWNEEEPEP